MNNHIVFNREQAMIENYFKNLFSKKLKWKFII